MSSGGKSSNERGSGRNKPGATVYDLVNVLIVNCPSDILGFFLLVVVLVEPRVGDGIYIDMSRDLGGWLPIVIVVMVSVFGKGGV